MPAFRGSWIVLAVLLEAALAVVVRLAQAPVFPLLPGLAWISAAGLVYLIAAAAVLHSPPQRLPRVRWILLAALVFRLTLLPLTPTLAGTAMRFRWDGKIQQAGFNPYAYAPQNAFFNPIRSPQEAAALPEPGVAAYHPPLAELLFRWNYAWFPGLRAQKILVTALDLLLLGVLVRMLKRRQQPPQWVLLYAWSPLAVFEVAGNGHLEPAAALFALLALHWAGRRLRPAALALASAALTQWYALLLLPAVLAPAGRRWLSSLAWLLGWGAVLTLPFLFANQQFLLGRIAANLRAHFAAQVPYNASLFALLHAWFGPPAAAAVAALLVAAAVATTRARHLEPLRAAFVILGALLLALPQVHPWTLLCLLPLLVFFPEAPWLYFSVAVLWAYAVAPHPFLVALEYLPLYALLAWQALRPRRRALPQAAA
ncbi:MAG TPA: hypothetical protein VMV31_07125 [Terriglobales bacterium]|nr:hypothetical protein [Terriglobales bacterium]